MKAKIFKRLKTINHLKNRALVKMDFDKFHKLEKRSELIEYYLKQQPIINREILI